MELRPLGFGEIFDRAVTLYIRNFVPFVAIVMVLVLPLAVLQYVIDVGSQPQFDAMIRVFQNPAAARVGGLPTIFDSPSTLAALGIVLLLTYTVWPFVLNAVAVGVARLYRNRPVGFRACYEVVLRRWLQVVGVILMELLILICWYAVFFIVVMIFAGVASYFAGGAIVLVAVVAVLFFCAFLLTLAPLFLALTFAMYATVLEERPVIESVGLGFYRIFNSGEFWRAVLFAIAAAAIILGASTMFSMLGLAAALLHLPLLQAVIQSLPTAIINPLAVVIMAVYYFDVRIRHEAFDLEAGLERLSVPTPA